MCAPKALKFQRQIFRVDIYYSQFTNAEVEKLVNLPTSPKMNDLS